MTGAPTVAIEQPDWGRTGVAIETLSILDEYSYPDTLTLVLLWHDAPRTASDKYINPPLALRERLDEHASARVSFG
ncbi:MAG: hypothetical protein ABI137_10010 [Antricoccus sp.]